MPGDEALEVTVMSGKGESRCFSSCHGADSRCSTSFTQTRLAQGPSISAVAINRKKSCYPGADVRLVGFWGSLARRIVVWYSVLARVYLPVKTILKISLRLTCFYVWCGCFGGLPAMWA